MASPAAITLSSLTPAQREILYTPSEGVLPDTSQWSVYARRLHELGLHGKSFRAEDEGRYFRHYKDAANETWREMVSNSMLRTVPHYAKQLARIQYSKYRHFESLIHLIFCKVTFRFNLDGETFPANKQTIKDIRKVITQFLPVTLDKIGDDRGWAMIKAIHAGSVDAALLAQIKQALPAGVSITHHNLYKNDFYAALLELVSPDLPRGAEARADFECVLEGIHQVKVHAVSRQDRGKFVYDPGYTNCPDIEATSVPADCRGCGKTHAIRIPRNPKTGLVAIFMSLVVDKDVLAAEIPECEWIRLPDAQKSPPL